MWHNSDEERTFSAWSASAVRSRLIFYLSCHVCMYVLTDFDINGSTVLNNVLYCTKIWLCVMVMVLAEVKITPWHIYAGTGRQRYNSSSLKTWKLGIRRKWVVSTMLCMLFPRGRHVTYCTGGWVGLGAGVYGTENLASTRIWSPDHPASSKALYLLLYLCYGISIIMNDPQCGQYLHALIPWHAQNLLYSALSCCNVMCWSRLYRGVTIPTGSIPFV
jgi:hypothetical protein